ncbi:MAG: hypothetical protein C4525_06130 [Desulfarculus sp.]|nr:MAG: hypothetical protein C4525_06130 [Desulfarculus sp.]
MPRLGVSRRTGYEWLARYPRGNAIAQDKHGSRPQRSPRRLKEEVLRCLQTRAEPVSPASAAYLA